MICPGVYSLLFTILELYCVHTQCILCNTGVSVSWHSPDRSQTKGMTEAEVVILVFHLCLNRFTCLLLSRRHHIQIILRIHGCHWIVNSQSMTVHEISYVRITLWWLNFKCSSLQWFYSVCNLLLSHSHIKCNQDAVRGHVLQQLLNTEVGGTPCEVTWYVDGLNIW